MGLYEKALAFAAEKHQGQRYGDEPYINHCIRVADKFKDDDLKAIAVLHDVMEDCNVDAVEFKELFGHEISLCIIMLSRPPDVSYEDFVAKVLLNDKTRLVKIADIEDHLAHVATLKPSLKKKYEKALATLMRNIAKG